MRSDKEAAALEDMREHIDLAVEWGKGSSIESLHVDQRSLYAIIRCLEIISEASRRLSPELKERHPHILWRGMADAGNVYRHKYEDVLPRRVWTTLHEHLPPLRAVIEEELRRSKA